MSNFSNITSLFGGTVASPLDIMSNVSDVITLNVRSGSSTGTPLSNYYGRYVYIGNLLIQFSDLRENVINNNVPAAHNGTFYVQFPISFSGRPYLVIPCIMNDSASRTGVMDINSTYYTNASCIIKTNDESVAIGFLAIGPR